MAGTSPIAVQAGHVPGIAGGAGTVAQVCVVPRVYAAPLPHSEPSKGVQATACSLCCAAASSHT